MPSSLSSMQTKFSSQLRTINRIWPYRLSLYLIKKIRLIIRVTKRIKRSAIKKILLILELKISSELKLRDSINH